MRKGFALSAVLWASCSLFTEANPSYCSSDGQCPDPMICNMQRHACELQESRPDDPAITAISPSAAARQGGFDVTIKGRNFDKVTEVQFAGVPGTNLMVRSGTELSITLPAGPGLCGLTTVTLRTSDGRAVKDSTHFRYRAANVKFPSAGNYVGEVGASPARLLRTRVSGNDSDDLLLGYASPTMGFSYIAINATGSIAQETKMTTGAPDLIEVKKLAQTTGVPGSGANLLIGNMASRISLYQATANNPSAFTVPLTQPTVGAHVDFTTGDFDKDGKGDLAVLSSSAGSSSISIYNSNSQGTYTTAASGGAVAIGESTRFAVADLDRDGYDDAVVVIKVGTSVGVLINNRLGGFIGPDIINVPELVGGVGIDIADMDLDGNPDIVAYGASGQTNAAVSIMYNDGKAGFSIVSMSNITGQANQIAIGDLDCDGLPDIVVYDGIKVTFYANTGRGTQFGTGVDLGSYMIQSMAIGQFSQDQQNDLALLQTSCAAVEPGKGCLRLLVNGSD